MWKLGDSGRPLVTSMQILAPLLITVVSWGCSGGEDVKKYAIEGMVSLEGLPVPKASLTFVPDATKGTTGPQAFAFARDGSFSIGAAEGLVAGEFNAEITLVDEQDQLLGKALKPITVDPKGGNVFLMELALSDLNTKYSREDGFEEEDEEEDD